MLEPAVRRTAMGCFGAAGALSCLVLTTWQSGHAGAGIFDLTASLTVSLLGLAVAAWLCHRRSDFVAVNRVGFVLALGTLVLSGIIISQNLFGLRWRLEEWLAVTLAVPGVSPRVHMTVETAFGCWLASLACLFGFRSHLQSRFRRQLAAVPALAVLILGGVILLCYLLQSPFFEHTTLLTGVEFSLLGLGLLLTAGFDVWPMSGLFLPSPATSSRRSWIWAILSLALLLGTTVIATRLYYFTSQKSLTIRAAQKVLATIADLKATQVTDWRKERLADADYLQHTPYITRRSLEVLAYPHLVKTEEMLRDWMEAMFAKKPYEQMLLLDEQLNVKLVYPRHTDGGLTEEERRAAEHATRLKGSVVADLHREDDQTPAQLSLVVPLVVRLDGGSENIPPPNGSPLPTDRSKGALLVRISADKNLSPMIRTWPTSSATSETMLVRREGDTVVCLNELRHRTNTALMLRWPVDRQYVETRAALGIVNSNITVKGATKGIDYRGVPVLALIRKIPDSPWAMIVKVDEEEVLSPVRRQGWVTAGLAGVLLGTAVLGINLIGRQRHLNSIQRELLLERRQRESEGRFRTLFESSRDAIILQDSATYLDCNPAALQLFGLAHKEQLLAKRPGDLSPSRQPDDSESKTALQQHFDAALAGGSRSFEWQFQRQDGTVFTGEMQLSRVELGGRTVLQAMIRDITERKRAEEDRLILSKLESTGVLAGGIAHDFNNLLSIIMMNLGMAESSSVKNLAQHLKAAEHATLAARNLTQQFITFAQKDAAFRQPTDLVGVIQESVSATLDGSDVRSEISVATSLRRAEMDGGQIGQVIRNLVLNAREAMSDGGILSIRAENFTVKAADGLKLSPGEYVRVSVSDPGHGIPADVLPKIFDPYFSTKQRGSQKGMGLGLTICHSVIQKHGGVITVDTKVGQGTTFAFYLPACAPTVAPAAQSKFAISNSFSC